MSATKVVSIVTGGNNSATTTAAEINAIATDFISNGVVGAISLNTGSGGTGSFAPNALGTPAMTVRITGGQGYVTATPSGGTSQRVRFAADTTEDVTIAANATGGTRYDWIYATISATTLANPGVNKDDVFTYTVSRSTSSSVDNGTPPTYGYNIAVVTVANGASSITNSNITDNRVQSGASAVGANAIKTADLQNASVTASKLSTGAATATVLTGEGTSSATFTDLATTTDSVTVTVGANGLLLVMWRTRAQHGSAGQNCICSVALSGANTVAASDNYITLQQGTTPTEYGTSHLFTGLTAGSTTVKMKYRTTAATATFTNREIIAIPL